MTDLATEWTKCLAIRQKSQHLVSEAIRELRTRLPFALLGIDSDNGSEFIGSWNARNDSSFTKTVQSFKGITHTTIPPGAHTFQADVETAHRLIEDEFYEAETFLNKRDFFNKATAYILWFNIARKNSYKENKTPWEIIREKIRNPNPNIPVLPAFSLNDVFRQKLKNQGPGGYHVGSLP